MAQISLGSSGAGPGARRNAGWLVTFAGTGINLALGILYTWSVISQAIPKEWGWTEAEKSLPYSIALLAFAFATIPAGRMQDKIGPRLVAALGGVLVGIGMILASFTTSPMGYVIGFGLLAATGIGFGYASATPPAIKWFGRAKTGLITGIVVAGFGLASVYAAPTAQWMSGAFGLRVMMMVFGVAFFVVVVSLAQFLRVPPVGYVPPEDAATASAKGAKPGSAGKRAAQTEAGPSQVLRTPQFYALWFMYACGAGAGLMIVSKMAKIATDQAGVSLGFVLVAVLAVGNGGGRILAGLLSDKIGRTRTLMLCFVLQAVLILVLSRTTTGSVLAMPVILGLCSALIGANYGANLAVFPAVSKDWYGLRNFGVNYGLLFTAWGVGGCVLSLVAGAVYDANHSFDQAYFLAAVLLVLAAGVSLLVHQPHIAPATEAPKPAVGAARG